VSTTTGAMNELGQGNFVATFILKKN